MGEHRVARGSTGEHGGARGSTEGAKGSTMGQCRGAADGTREVDLERLCA